MPQTNNPDYDYFERKILEGMNSFLGLSDGEEEFRSGYTNIHKINLDADLDQWLAGAYFIKAYVG